jgi:AsmA protein
MIEGPWAAPRIYPEMQGMLDNPEAAYAKLKEMGKGLFGANGAGLNGAGIGAAIGGLLGGGQPGASATPGTGQDTQTNDPLGGQLGATLGNLLQQGLSGLSQGGTGQPGAGQGAARPSQGRNIPSPDAATPAAPAETPAPATPAPADTTAQQDSQPMNDVLRQLFNR